MAGLIPADAVAVGMGAVLGAVSRYQAGRWAAEWIATDPKRLSKFAGWHTAGINIGGSFLLGAISASPVIGASTTSGGAIGGNKEPPTTRTGSPTTTTTTTPPPTTTTTSRKNNGLVHHPKLQSLQGVLSLSPRAKLLLGVGFCGSFTTFSTFSVDVVTLLGEGKTARALGYVATNNIGGLVAAAAGMMLVKKIFR
jgi:fluoride ion exporter CrcB/FEX